MDIMNVNETTSFSKEIVDIIRSYDLLQDRLPGDVLTLPVSWYELKIKVNDFAVAETINYSLESLHKNLMYLLAYSVIPTNDIPNSLYTDKMIIDLGPGGMATWTGTVCSVDTTLRAVTDSWNAIQGNNITLSGDGVSDLNDLVNTWNNNNINNQVEVHAGDPLQIPDDGQIMQLGGAYNRGVRWADQSDFDAASNTGDFSGINHLIKISNLIDSNNFNMIAATQTNIIMLSGSDVTDIDVILNPDALGGVIRSDSSVTHPSNGILFKDIKGIVVTDALDLFVLDGAGDDTIAGNKSVFKFDITGMTALDEAILKNDTPGRLMTSMVGGDGAINDKTRFVNPICITTHDNNIFIVDYEPVSQITVIKQYDSHLNWKQSYNLGVVDELPVIDMKYNSLNDAFYILCHEPGLNKPGRLIEYTAQFELVGGEPLMDASKHDVSIANETHMNIHFSLENQNMMYLVTNKNVYKKYVSRPTSFVGEFQFDRKNIGPSDTVRDFKNMTMFPVYASDGITTMLKDEILLIESGRSGVYRFLEDSGYETSLETRVDDNIIRFGDIMVKPEENVDSLVYNKALYKTLFNNLLLLENMSRRFSTIYDSKGFSRYRGFKYLNNTELEQMNYEITPDNYVSSNEIVLTHTINRCLKLLFDLQEHIMGKMQETSVNVFPLEGVPVELD